MKTVIQCDFDGTITQEDVGFLLLDTFAAEKWKQLLAEYREGKISVGYFNTMVFAMVKADEETLVKFVKRNGKTRDGFLGLLTYCRQKDFRFAIVSNGLDFYINTILSDMGLDDIEVFAAQTRFGLSGIEAKYLGPDGGQLNDGFKESYSRLFLEQGYRIIYVGNGLSDIPPAKLAHLVFARDELLAYFKRANLKCSSYADLDDVIKGLELLR